MDVTKVQLLLHRTHAVHSSRGKARCRTMCCWGEGCPLQTYTHATSNRRRRGAVSARKQVQMQDIA